MYNFRHVEYSIDSVHVLATFELLSLSASDAYPALYKSTNTEALASDAARVTLTRIPSRLHGCSRSKIWQK